MGAAPGTSPPPGTAPLPLAAAGKTEIPARRTAAPASLRPCPAAPFLRGQTERTAALRRLQQPLSAPTRRAEGLLSARSGSRVL